MFDGQPVPRAVADLFTLRDAIACLYAARRTDIERADQRWRDTPEGGTTDD
jgi:hypothetical protein